jgi:hypothetical protein
MTTPEPNLQLVEAALAKAVDGRAKKLMKTRSRYLADLTPYEMAQTPAGARVVLAELDKIALEAYAQGAEHAA